MATIIFCYLNLSNLMCTKDFVAVNFRFYAMNYLVWKMSLKNRFCYSGKVEVIYRGINSHFQNGNLTWKTLTQTNLSDG